MADDRVKSGLGLSLLREALKKDALAQPLPGPTFIVKNTFIDGFKDEGEETPSHVNPMMKSRTVPVQRVRAFSNADTPVNAAQDAGDGVPAIIREGDDNEDVEEEEEASPARGPVMHSWASLSSPDASNGLGGYWGGGGAFGIPAMAPMMAVAPDAKAAPPMLQSHCDSCGNVYMQDSFFCRKCGKQRQTTVGAVPGPAAPAPATSWAVVAGTSGAPPAQVRPVVQRQAIAQQTRVVPVQAAQRQVIVKPQATVAVAKPPPPAAGVITPLPHRKPEMSIGADKHGTGTCKPCAWFWKPQGCQHSHECGYCHMCPEGELKERKKHKAAEMRHANAA